MRKIVISFLVILGFLGTPVILSAEAWAQEQVPSIDSSTFADLAEDLLPSVVNISSTQKLFERENFPELPQFPPGSPFEDFFEQFMNPHGHGFPIEPPASLGSGFVVDAEKGYIVTNNHVISDADEVRVTFHEDTTVEAEIIGRDEKMDLAVLKVDADIKLTAVKFGDSDVMRIGDWILAIGNPFGLGGTVTAGIVSAQQRNINAGPYDDFIQTDASINRGNSGGPMFNLQGQVIGINTAIFSPSGGSVGIGFAIPSKLAEPVIRQLIEYGRTRRGWLGVRIQMVSDEIAENLGLDKPKGALVAIVTPSGPAEKGGLKTGDVILEFNGQDVDTMRELPRIVAETTIGSEAGIIYWRDGKEHSTTVVLGELEKAEEEGLVEAGPMTDRKSSGTSKKIASVGLSVGEIASTDREEFLIPDDVNGVIVLDVDPGSEAERKGIVIGDVIVEVNQKEVNTASDAVDIIEKAEKSGRSSVLLLVNHEGDVRFVALRLKDK